MGFGADYSQVLSSIPVTAFSRQANRWVLLLSDAKISVSPEELLESSPKKRGRKPKLSIDPSKPGQAIGLAKRDAFLGRQVPPAAPHPVVAAVAPATRLRRG